MSGTGNIKLGELLRETDALTYINALKVTQMEIKTEIGKTADLVQYLVDAQERVEKLVRRADNQYRLIAKLATRQNPVVTNVTVSAEDLAEYEELMEDV